jgi:hypothetical protein
MMRLILLSFVFFPLFSLGNKDSLQIVADVQFVWQSEFSEKEKNRVMKIMKTHAVQAQMLLGKYPFKLKFYITRYNQSWGPLVGCHVKFNESVRGVYAGVDLSYTNKEFYDSWKMPHEISHLAIPGLGSENSWFAEGFATFMSRQIMAYTGKIGKDAPDSTYLAKFKEVKSSFNSDETFLTVIRGLVTDRNYSAYYWGGATFFYRADQILKEKHNSSMCAVVKAYQKPVRLSDKSLFMVIKSWDAIVGANVFSSLMYEYRNEPARTVMGRVF